MTSSSKDSGAKKAPQPSPAQPPAPDAPASEAEDDGAPKKRPDPTRYGDWEKDGRCIDF